jgi:hypothetical protein
MSSGSDFKKRMQELAIKSWRDHMRERFALGLFPVFENLAVAEDACGAGAQQAAGEQKPPYDWTVLALPPFRAA